MAKFRKKPVAIDAEQFDPNATNWPEGVVVDTRSPTGYSIGTLENTAQGHEVTPGDWIITGVKGEKYPCKDDVFRQTYERVDEPQQPLSVTMLSEPGYGRSRLIDKEEIIEIDDAGSVSLVAAAAADYGNADDGNAFDATAVGILDPYPTYVGPDEVTVDTVQPPEPPSSAACQTTWNQASTTNTDVCVDTSISFDSVDTSGGGFDPGN